LAQDTDISLWENGTEIAVIIYTGHGSIPTAVAAIRREATDYLNKPFSPEELKLSIRKALEEAERKIK